MDSKHSSGFTFLELIIVILILAILSGFAVITYKKMAASSELERYAWNVWKDLTGVRPQVMKYDKQCKVRFKNKSYLIDRATKVDTIKLPANIGFAIAKSGPSKDPFGRSIPVDSGGKSNWKDSLVVKRDAIGTINEGYVSISSSRLEKITYFIGIYGTLQSIVIYKWTGTSWVKL